MLFLWRPKKEVGKQQQARMKNLKLERNVEHWSFLAVLVGQEETGKRYSVWRLESTLRAALWISVEAWRCNLDLSLLEQQQVSNNDFPTVWAIYLSPVQLRNRIRGKIIKIRDGHKSWQLRFVSVHEDARTMSHKPSRTSPFYQNGSFSEVHDMVEWCLSGLEMPISQWVSS